MARNYMNLTWVTSTPVSRGFSRGNAFLLCSGNAPGGCDNPQLVTSSSYTSLIPSTRWEYTALQSYYSNFTGSPTNTTYLYWMGAGERATGIAVGEGLEWEIKYGPYDSIDRVAVDPTGGSNWQELTTFDITSNESGYIANTGDYGKYDGSISFSGVYVDADTADDGGPAFTSGDTDYSGQLARDIIDASGGRFEIRATRNGFGVAAKEILKKDNQFVCAVRDVTSSAGGKGYTGVMGDGTGATEDLQNCLGICAGNLMQTVWALPAAASPNTIYHDADISQEYQNLRDYVGQDQNAIVFYADVATGSDGSGLDDPAAALLGKICDTAPHTTLTLADINISLNSRTNKADKAAWDDGQIICVFRKSELGFSTDQLNYGFTFAGTSPNNRLNNVRCRYQVQFNVMSDLWSALSSRNIRISKAGLRQLISIINGTLDRMEDSDIIDAGSRKVEIPLMNGTAAEWSNAKLNRYIPAIKIRWTWNTSPEQLNITEFGEIL